MIEMPEAEFAQMVERGKLTHRHLTLLREHLTRSEGERTLARIIEEEHMPSLIRHVPIHDRGHFEEALRRAINVGIVLQEPVHSPKATTRIITQLRPDLLIALKKHIKEKGPQTNLFD